MGATPVLKHGARFVGAACILSGCWGTRIHLGDGAQSTEPDSTSFAPMQDASLPPETTPEETTSNTAEQASSTHDTEPVTDVPSESTAGADGGNECTSGGVAADEVVWIGDSWLKIPGVQQTRVEELARQAGALQADEEYVSLATEASDLAAVVRQYETRKAGLPPKVLIMDGGTWDTIFPSGSEDPVPRVVADFIDFLALVESDGSVQHIIYMLVPELPTIPGVAELRPGLLDACNDSAVPCHFLDLQPLWEGNPDYTSMPDGIQASVQGATVIADEIWSIMQRECIAQ